MEEIQEESTWHEQVNFLEFPPLKQSIEVDILVIGGGLAGITTAYLLSKANYNVALIEKSKIGQGATHMTTAFLTQYIDTDIADLISMFGKEKTKKILDSHITAIDIIEKIVKEESIECEFMRCSNYIYTNSSKDRSLLEKEFKAAKGVGLNITSRDGDKLPFATSYYLELQNQGKFHPLKYLSALTKIIKNRGVQIYEDTEAEEIIENGSVGIEANGQEIIAQKIVVATYAPFDKKLYFKKGFYTSYALEITTSNSDLPEAIYEDTYNPYNYFRVDKMEDRDRIILGGADHRADIPVDKEKNFKSLKDYTSKILSGHSYNIVKRWSGPIVEPVDGLAYIGSLKNNNIFYGTGFSGNGMTYSTIAAVLISDLIQDKRNDWLSLYDASRMPTVKQLAYKGRDYTGELVGGAVKNTIRH